jgi:hypothetical protein
MDVYSSDNQNLGHVKDIYEDSFAIHKGLFAHDRYIPYNSISEIENDHIHIQLSADELHNMKWRIRPDYENHPGDPLQHFYDRGHGIQDPFDGDTTD